MFPFAPKSTLNLLALRYLFHFRFFLLNFLFCFEFRLYTNQSTFLKHTTKSIWSSWQRISSSIPNKRTNRYSITGTNEHGILIRTLYLCVCVFVCVGLKTNVFKLPLVKTHRKVHKKGQSRENPFAHWCTRQQIETACCVYTYNIKRTSASVLLTFNFI